MEWGAINHEAEPRADPSSAHLWNRPLAPDSASSNRTFVFMAAYPGTVSKQRVKFKPENVNPAVLHRAGEADNHV